MCCVPELKMEFDEPGNLQGETGKLAGEMIVKREK
jgi:hypothetical protein